MLMLVMGIFTSIACVADAQSYALLDVDRQFKIPLFPISSNDDSQSGGVSGRVEDISGKSGGGYFTNHVVRYLGRLFSWP
jgi:vacuolar protein sorting-associated protein 3